MLCYCLKNRKNTEFKNPSAIKTKSERVIFLLKCVVLDSKKARFIENKEISKLFCKLRLETHYVKFQCLVTISGNY